MDYIEIIGYMAGFIVSISLAPQLIKTFKTKSAKDISIAWTIILMSGLILWVTYGVLNHILPLALFAAIECTMALTLCIFKMYYK